MDAAGRRDEGQRDAPGAAPVAAAPARRPFEAGDEAGDEAGELHHAFTLGMVERVNDQPHATVALLTPLASTPASVGAHLRSDIVAGLGGRQILVEHPSGNPIELFQP